MTKKQQVLLSALFIIVTVFAAFSPALKNGFTNWDDNIFVTENNLVKDVSWENIKAIFNFSPTGVYSPFVFLSYAAEYRFFKLNPHVYHATNITFHTINCLLVFWFIYILSGKINVAFIVSLLFGLHPLKVESVAWITERKDVMYAFFYLSGLISYCYYRASGKNKFFLLSLLLFVCSAFSKSTAVTFVFVLILLDYFFYGKPGARIITEKALFIILSLFFGVIAVMNATLVDAVQKEKILPFFKGLEVGSYNIFFYLFKTVFPFKLSAFYPYPESILNKQLPLIFLFSVFALIIVAAIIVFSFGYTKKPAFGSLFFLCAILPVLQIFPAGAAIAADRYTYLPSIGLFYVFAEGFGWLWQKNLRPVKAILTILLCAVIVLLSYLSWKRCHIWKDSISLWSDVLLKYPNIISAHKNLAIAYGNAGEYDKAITEFTGIIECNPADEEAYNDRGITYFKAGKYDKAIDDYTKAITLSPDFPKPYFNRGNVYGKIGNYRKATEDYTRTIELDPSHIKSYYNRAAVYEKTGNRERAKKDLAILEKMGYPLTPPSPSRGED